MPTPTLPARTMADAIDDAFPLLEDQPVTLKSVGFTGDQQPTRPSASVPVPVENVYTQLSAFQAELPRIRAAETARVNPKDGGSGYAYSYAGLDHVADVVLKRLGKLGLAWVTRPTMVNDRGGMALAYELVHGATLTKISGEWPLTASSGQPQALGSQISYFRRYALLAVTGVFPGGEDEDARVAHNQARAEADAPPQARRERPARREQPARPAPAAAAQPAASAAADTESVTIVSPQGGVEALAATPKQLQQLHIKLNELGVTDRDQQLAGYARVIGRKVESSKDLTAVECDKVIAALNRRLTEAKREQHAAEQAAQKAAAEAPQEDPEPEPTPGPGEIIVGQVQGGYTEQDRMQLALFLFGDPDDARANLVSAAKAYEKARDAGVDIDAPQPVILPNGASGDSLRDIWLERLREAYATAKLIGHLAQADEAAKESRCVRAVAQARAAVAHLADPKQA